MITLLLVTATLLGLLAFFEPCTIATHTLFSVRVNKLADRKSCCQSLLTVWLSRSALLVILFTLSVLVMDTPQWSDYMPSIILAVIAVVYVVSRFI